eukprot:447669-Rhodomonas_salina.2
MSLTCSVDSGWGNSERVCTAAVFQKSRRVSGWWWSRLWGAKVDMMDPGACKVKCSSRSLTFLCKSKVDITEALRGWKAPHRKLLWLHPVRRQSGIGRGRSGWCRRLVRSRPPHAPRSHLPPSRPLVRRPLFVVFRGPFSLVARHLFLLLPPKGHSRHLLGQPPPPTQPPSCAPRVRRCRSRRSHCWC